MNIWKLAKKNGMLDELYEHEIIKRIRQKYSINQELAILRQRDTKPTEFEKYNEFVEQCKAEVKELLKTVESEV